MDQTMMDLPRKGERLDLSSDPPGVGPSPKVGQATKFLLEKVLDEPELNTPEKLRDVLRDWQAGLPA